MLKFNLGFGRMLAITMLAATGVVGVSGQSTVPPTSLGNEKGQPAGASSTSKESERKSAIIRQTSELTCGPAALASLMKFYFGVETSEDEIARLSGTYEKGTTTLLGLRNASRAKGYEAIGYRMSFAELMREVETTGIPVLVHFVEPSLHYALVLGRVEDFVLVSDPSRGNISMHESDFMRRWDNTALVVKSLRPTDSTRIEKRKQSAAKRLDTLRRSAALLPRY